jgi:hypothetical protein
MKTNSLNPEKKKKEKKPSTSKGRFGKATHEVLGGGVFEKERTFRMFPFLLFLSLLAFIYITNDFTLESKVREISRLQKEVKELRYEYISVKSNLITISKQSQLAKRLEKLGIKENKEPLKVIRIKVNK